MHPPTCSGRRAEHSQNVCAVAAIIAEPANTSKMLVGRKGSAHTKSLHVVGGAAHADHATGGCRSVVPRPNSLMPYSCLLIGWFETIEECARGC